MNSISADECEKVISEIDNSKKYRIKLGEKLLYIIDKCDDHEKSEIIFLRSSVLYTLSFSLYLSNLKRIAALFSQNNDLHL